MTSNDARIIVESRDVERRGGIVPDDLGDRIRRRHEASSSAIVGQSRREQREQR